MPKVLISDALEPARRRNPGGARDRGRLLPGLAADELKARIGDYDGLAVRSATKVTRGCSPAPRSFKIIGRAGIGVDNIDVAAATAARHRRHEHALWQLDHRRRARDRADVRAVPPDPGRRPLDPGRQMGESRASWASSSPARRSASSAAAMSARSSPSAPCGLQMKVIAYDPFLSAERAVDLGVEKVTLDELFAARRFHYPAHAADRRDPEPDRRRGDRQDETRGAPHQLRARRSRRRGGSRRRARQRPCRRRRDRRLCRGAGDRKPALRPRQCRRHPASRRRRPARRRRMSRCRSPSRWPISC